MTTSRRRRRALAASRLRPSSTSTLCSSAPRTRARSRRPRGSTRRRGIAQVLFHASALIAAAALPADAAARFFAAAAAAADLESLIAALLAEVLGGCDRRLRAAARAPADAAKEAWRAAAEHVRRIAADVEALLAQGGGAAAQQWRALSIVQLFVRECALLPEATGAVDAKPFDVLVDVAGAHTVGAHEPFLRLLDAVQRAAASAAYAPASATAAAVEAEAEEASDADGVPFAARCAEAAVGAIVVAYVEEVLLSAADATTLELEPALAATLVELVGVAPTAAARLPRAARAQLLHALQRAAPAVAPLASALRALPKLGPAGSVEWLRLRENALAPPPAAAAATARVAVFRAINAAANEVQGSATAAQPPAADVAAAAPPLPPMSAEEIKSAATLGGGAESAAALLRRTDALDRLEAVAQAKRRVVAYAAALIEVLRDGGAAAGRAATALLNSSADARKLLTSGMVGPRQIQVMVLRLVWRAGGMPLLGKVLALPRNATEWVPVDASAGAALMQATPLLDPFRWLLPDQQARGAAYGGIVKMTKTILTFRGRDASELTRLDKWVGDRVKEKTSLFAVVAAAFSLTSEVLMPEGALKRETEDPVGEQMLRTAGIGRLASDGVRELCLWVLDGCDGGALGRGLVPPQHPRNPTKPKGKRRQQLLLQLTVDVALRATMQADSWWHAVLFRPAELIRSYVPTMSGEESLDVMRSAV